VMTTLNALASRQALDSGARCATDITGFGLLGHLFKLARASGVTAVIDHAAVPLIDGARKALRAGYVPGGSRRNLDWVSPHADFGRVGEEDLLLLADAQTSGGLLVAGEIPGAPVIGELIPRGAAVLIIRLSFPSLPERELNGCLYSASISVPSRRHPPSSAVSSLGTGSPSALRHIRDSPAGGRPAVDPSEECPLCVLRLS
jgi:AIR synthase related protein, C-terminal domain